MNAEKLAENKTQAAPFVFKHEKAALKLLVRLERAEQRWRRIERDLNKLGLVNLSGLEGGWGLVDDPKPYKLEYDKTNWLISKGAASFCRPDQLDPVENDLP